MTGTVRAGGCNAGAPTFFEHKKTASRGGFAYKYKNPTIEK